MKIIKDENGLIVNKAWPIETVRAEAALAAMVEEQSRQTAVRASHWMTTKPHCWSRQPARNGRRAHITKRAIS